MFKIHSVTGRIFIGVLVGLIYVLVLFVFTQVLHIPLPVMFSLGTLMIFIMMGFTIGFVGIFDRHPIFGIKMHWWLRGIVGGTIFGLIYVFLGYDSITPMMQAEVMQKLNLSSPFWAMTDFILSGLIMAFLETKIAGDGSKLPLK